MKKVTGVLAVCWLAVMLSGCQTTFSSKESADSQPLSSLPFVSEVSEDTAAGSSRQPLDASETSMSESGDTADTGMKESSVPVSRVLESSVPVSRVQDVSVTESSVPNAQVSQTDVSQVSVPVQESYVHEISVNEPSVTEPQSSVAVSQAELPQVVGQPIVDVYTPYTAARLQRDIAALCRRYPDLVTQYIIGITAQGRKISCVTLGFGSKKGCIVAGIHAREHITVSFTMRCLEEFAEAYRRNEPYGEYDLRQLLQVYTLYFVPMCNPDGTEISVNGAQPLVAAADFSPDEYKLNGNGVNLNRNFPYNWEEQYTHQTFVAGEEKYAGDHAASEKETQAIMSLCEEEHFAWLLDMHVVGNGIYWRDEMNGPIEGDSRMRGAITERCGYRYFGESTDVTVYSGGLENWFRYAYGKPAFCIEMVPYEQSGRVSTYIGMSSFFEEAVNWPQTKYTYLAAMVSG